jgi:hypothetical protein
MLDAQHGEVSKDADDACELYPKSGTAANKQRRHLIRSVHPHKQISHFGVASCTE